MFQRRYNHVAEIIREYEAETGEIVPRCGNFHDMGRTLSHKRIIYRKAYLEAKLTPQIAQEAFHSTVAVDNYILDFARSYFAAFQRVMTIEETAFAIQRPHCLVEEYAKLIEEFGLDEWSIYYRVGVQMMLRFDDIVPSTVEYSW